jgi:hypothetical protein
LGLFSIQLRKTEFWRLNSPDLSPGTTQSVIEGALSIVVVVNGRMRMQMREGRRLGVVRWVVSVRKRRKAVDIELSIWKRRDDMYHEDNGGSL